MSATDEFDFYLPTAKQVRMWERMLELLSNEHDEMKARHAAEEKAVRTKMSSIRKLIDAGSGLVEAKPEGAETESATLDIEPNQELTNVATLKKFTQRGRGKTWTATILKVVKAARHGVTYRELKAEISKTHLGSRLNETDKALYGGVGKLAEKKKIVKHNGKLYSPAAYNQFKKDVQAGLIDDVPVSQSGQESPNEIAVERILAGQPNGATPGEIVHSLLNHPPPDLAVTRNKNTIYNVLARCRANGDLIKRGDRYYLPRRTSKAPDSNESSASQNDGGGTGNPSSNGIGGLTTPDAAPGATPATRGEEDPERKESHVHSSSPNGRVL